jgi:hypothetical protein
MIPVDLTKVLRSKLASNRRPPDGLLHPSGDLLGSLRHAQLRLAGAPTVESEIVSDIRLATGTMWHRFIGDMLVSAGAHFEQEISVNPGLPTGWSGTADALFWNQERRGFVLVDFKTIKGEGMRWIVKEGAKEEHLWQLSAYWHALYDMGYPMVEGFAVWYIPMNDTVERGEFIEPLVMECDPLPRTQIHRVMSDKWEAVQTYLSAMDDDLLTVAQRALLADQGLTDLNLSSEAIYVTDQLAPEMARVQKLYLDSKRNLWDVKLVPHWSAAYCPYPTELCGCSEQGTTKIGHYTLDGKYEPRKGYEKELPMVEPAEYDYAKQRRKAAVAEAGNLQKPASKEEDDADSSNN